MAAILVISIAVVAGGLVMLSMNRGGGDGPGGDAHADAEVVDPFAGLAPEAPPEPRSSQKRVDRSDKFAGE